MELICMRPNARLPSDSFGPTALGQPRDSFHAMALSKSGSIPYCRPASFQQLAWHRTGAHRHVITSLNDRMEPSPISAQMIISRLTTNCHAQVEQMPLLFLSTCRPT